MPRTLAYFAVIPDLNSRRVVGWAVSDRMKKDLAIRALDMAVCLRKGSRPSQSRNPLTKQQIRELKYHGRRESAPHKRIEELIEYV